MYNEESGLFINSSNNDIVATFNSSNTTISLHIYNDLSNGFVIQNHMNTLSFERINNIIRCYITVKIIV